MIVPTIGTKLIRIHHPEYPAFAMILTPAMIVIIVTNSDINATTKRPTTAMCVPPIVVPLWKVAFTPADNTAALVCKYAMGSLYRLSEGVHWKSVVELGVRW